MFCTVFGSFISADCGEARSGHMVGVGYSRTYVVALRAGGYAATNVTSAMMKRLLIACREQTFTVAAVRFRARFEQLYIRDQVFQDKADGFSSLFCSITVLERLKKTIGGGGGGRIKEQKLLTAKNEKKSPICRSLHNLL